MNNLGPWETPTSTTTFCGCVLDSETQTLQSKTEIIRLRSKLWQVLIQLISHSNKVVHRDSLIENIWHGNRYTGEQGLTHAICHLRRIMKKLGIEAKIVTLPKKGYILKYQNSGVNDANYVSSFSSGQELNSFNESSSPLMSSTFDFVYNSQ